MKIKITKCLTNILVMSHYCNKCHTVFLTTHTDQKNKQLTRVVYKIEMAYDSCTDLVLF